MLIKESVLKIIDNIGAKNAKCILILGSFKYAKVGDLIMIVLRNYFNIKNKIKKKSIYLGIITNTKYWLKRLDGDKCKFNYNGILVFNFQLKFLGTRIKGLLSKELKKKFHRYNGYRFFYKMLQYSCNTI